MTEEAPAIREYQQSPEGDGGRKMSISFQDDINPEARELLMERFKDHLVAMDARRALINHHAFDAATLGDIARAAQQPATLEIHAEGEIKTMSDGTQYRVTNQGWRKI